ncbi:MAG: hypothetical protein KGH53_02665 [Candidatus Micrarchaeota archaeon]|nr:hypothetical protein [Candidatus Micrarchaeota archaeon]
MAKETLFEKRERLMNAAKASLSDSYAGSEHSIMQAISSYLEVEKVRNQMFERLEEWYSIYFPEYRANSSISLAKFVINFGANKKAPSVEELRSKIGEGAEKLKQQIENSIGREPTAEEFETLKSMAESEITLQEVGNKIDKYLEVAVKKLMPNISYLIDYKIAAELLAKAGSLERLGTMPASTLQLLGAEKALFKHLKFGTKPPKYGILFKLPQIVSAPKKQKGRLARLYANKLSIASKGDAFTHNFIAEKLKADIAKSVARQKGGK